MPIFISSSSNCAVRQEDVVYIFHDPANPELQARGTWDDVVNLAMKIIGHEAEANGGTAGSMLAAIESYANGIISGVITEQSEEFARDLLAHVQAIKSS